MIQIIILSIALCAIALPVLFFYYLAKAKNADIKLNIIFFTINIILVVLTVSFYLVSKERKIGKNEEYFYKELSVLLNKEFMISSRKNIQFMLKDFTNFEWNKVCFSGSANLFFDNGSWTMSFYDNKNKKIKDIELRQKDIRMLEEYVPSSPLGEKSDGFSSGCYDNKAEFIIVVGGFYQLSTSLTLYSTYNFKQN